MTADWAMVWITAVYVIATCMICWANIRSAKATREQLAESRRQFEEENRAYITYSFIYEKHAFYGLRFVNHGKRVAQKVKIALKNDFIQSLTETQFANSLKRASETECVLGIDQSMDIYFGGEGFRDNQKKLPIEGDVFYEDDKGKYVEHFVIDFNNYPPIFLVDSELEDIRKEMKIQIQELKRLREEVALLRKDIAQEKNHE